MSKKQKEQIITGYKATDKGLKCRGYQYDVGKTYTAEGEISLCRNGFHFCENPFDVLDYYSLCDSEFVTVEAMGKSETDGKKTVAQELTITANIELPGWIKASFDFLWKKCTVDPVEKSSGRYSQLAASGDYSQLAASGHSSKLAASGHSSKLAASGDYSIAAGIGIENKAKGSIGSWLVLAEWRRDETLKRYVPICVKAEHVDGVRIKADCWYSLVDGEFMEEEA